MRVLLNRNWSAVAFALAMLFSSAVIAADQAPVDPRLAHLGPLAGKLDRRLIPSVQALLDGKMTGSALTPHVHSSLSRSLASTSANRLPLVIDAVRVDVALIKSIQATGTLITHSSAKLNSVSCQATIEEIAALTEVPGVRAINLAHKPSPRKQGTADNQGDVSMKANQARTNLGLTGKGQKIGVVSDSINQTTNGTGITTGTTPNATLSNMTNQISGDLPANIQVIDFGPTGGTDEGAAMLELIYDIAPGAVLAFASSGADQPTMHDNILALKTAGCNIIVDDIGFPDEPFFQDGPIAQAIRTNFNAGVTHFCAIGNDGNAGVLANYTAVNAAAPADANPLAPSGNFFHDWGIGGAKPGFLPINIPDGTNFLNIIVQWNQPDSRFNLGAGSSVDLDAFLYDSTNLATANILDSSTDPQFAGNIPNGNPNEIMSSFTNNTGSTKTVYLAVNLAAGSSANLVLRVIIQSDLQLTFPSNGVNGMTAYGHTTLDEAISVGAIFYGDIDSGGKWAGDLNNEDPNAINAEAFSSKGGIGANGVPFYFDTAGNPLANAPVRRNAPSIAAPDRVNNTFFGNDISFVINGVTYDSDSLPNFEGTSAAAPNAAAVAALLLERAPLSTPSQIKLALQNTAIDIVATAPLSSVGPDDMTGAGLVNALAAANALPAIITNPISQTTLDGNSITFSVVASGAATLSYQWFKNGTLIPNATSASLQLTNVLISDDGAKFYCIVNNSVGTVSSTTATLTVHQGPKITQQPVSQLINYGSTATFTCVGNSGFITYQWQRNGTPISGATNPSYTTAAVGPSDDGALYTCVVSNQFANITSNTAKLSANPPPAIFSGPTANPGAGIVGQTIQFLASAIGANNTSVNYLWDFGDGTSATGAPVTHVYAAAQNYAVTLTVTDANGAISSGKLTEIIFVDANADGLPDLDPAIDNSSFVDALRIIKGYMPQSLVIKSLIISLNFAKIHSDTLTLTGSLPVPAGFNATNSPVTLIVGGVGRTLLLNAKGKGTSTPNGTFQLMFSTKAKGPTFGKFSFKMSKANIQSIVASSSNLANVNATNEGRIVRATIFFNGGMYDIAQPQTYTAKMGKTGKTK